MSDLYTRPYQGGLFPHLSPARGGAAPAVPFQPETGQAEFYLRKLREMEEILASKHRENDKLRERVIELENGVNHLLREREGISAELTNARNFEMRVRDEKLKEISAENESLRIRFNEIEAANQRLINEKDTMSAELRQTYLQLEQLRDQMAELQRVYAHNFEGYKNQLGQQMLNEIDRVRRELGLHFDSEKGIMESEIGKLRGMLKDLELKMNTTAEENTRLNIFSNEKSRENEELRRRLFDVDSHGGKLATDVEHLRNQNKEYLRAIDAWRLRVAELEKELVDVNALQQENARLFNRTRDLERDNAELMRRANSAFDLEKENQRLVRLVEQLENENDKLRTDLEQAGYLAGHKERQLQDMAQERDYLRSFPTVVPTPMGPVAVGPPQVIEKVIEKPIFVDRPMRREHLNPYGAMTPNTTIATGLPSPKLPIPPPGGQIPQQIRLYDPNTRPPTTPQPTNPPQFRPPAFPPPTQNQPIVPPLQDMNRIYAESRLM
eukprot:TRINITY_DN6610_c0_g4_i1.p1 TRINITY_DN6610_c0_g4~~TRINITY_DN6610_c0_g4_i1.p1  ORF type:complete len:496 (+),score=62.95 TRINITY_DN6610_c0_g4_i1:130-1617(+)